MKDRLLIIGAGGHGKVCADIALKMNQWKEICFLDDDRTKKEVMGLRVLDTPENVSKYTADSDIFVAIGNNRIRKRMFEKLKSYEAKIPDLIHPSAIIGKNVEIGVGTVIMPGAIVNCSTQIDSGCIINTGAIIEHDNIIGKYVHISPGAKLAGGVVIGNEVWIGIGSVIINNINIHEKCIIGAGTLIIKDIANVGTYVGVPARNTRNNK